MDNPEPSQNRRLLEYIGGFLLIAGGFLRRALRSHARPKELTAAEYVQIHRDLQEQLKPILQQLEEVADSLREVRSDVASVRGEMGQMSKSISRHDGIIAGLDRRLDASGA